MASNTAIAGINGEDGIFYPTLSLLKDKFTVKNVQDQEANATAVANLQSQIQTNNMVPFYEAVYLKELCLPPLQASVVSEMCSKNEEQLRLIDEKIADAEKNLGETDILELLQQKASFYCQIGDKERAIEALKLVMSKTSAAGTKIDCYFCMVRLAFVFEDHKLIESSLERCKILIEEGGDWDRRNKMKIYEACHAMLKRDFQSCATLLTSSLATFTYAGMLTLKEVAKYCVISTLFKFNRKDLKDKVLNAPEVIEMLNELPTYQQLLVNFYNCQYAGFFKALAQAEIEMLTDFFLFPHATYIVNELKIAAYSQLLQSYKTISIDSVAGAFGVTEEFIDNDLSKLIVAGRISGVIDKVNNVIESKRSDTKNYLYQTITKHGDLVLTRIQNLSRIINA